ncbi:flagellar hook capping FlgD N-terminal domain-containing protein [Vogesella sp. GCM10023246]|uniref:Basal-body rod modification protein FlgD n=1 Tax=Vogesella oryzagri TaxID=3160864 RepID=A0ABV1M783_9NEIS
MQATLNNNSATTASGSSAVGGNGDASGLSDMFTKLLVAQIQNQDPLQPSDPSQFVSQLTQLSQVEALQKMASQSVASNSSLQGLQVLTLGREVGSSLMVSTSALQLGSEPVAGRVTLGSSSSKVTLLLTGSDGSQYPLALGAHPAGDVNFSIDPAQHGLPAGNYSVAVQTDTGVLPAVEVAGRLQSVRLGSSGNAVLTVSGVGAVDASAITQFNGQAANVAS